MEDKKQNKSKQREESDVLWFLLSLSSAFFCKIKEFCKKFNSVIEIIVKNDVLFANNQTNI